jgi:hypothetical protein
MHDPLLWLYFAGAILLINHEIDSAYWKEWEMFKLPGGIQFFLLLHVIILAAILWGLVLVARGDRGGLWFSLLLSMGGLFAFVIHMLFLKKGRPEFRTPASLAILWILFIVSLGQGILTIVRWIH